MCLHSDTCTADAAIQSIFGQYQKLREPRVRKLYNSAHLMTRLGSWDTYFTKFIALFMLPRIDDAAAVSSLIRGAVKADFIPTPHRSKGFADNPKHFVAMGNQLQRRVGWQAMRTYAIVGGVACTTFVALGWLRYLFQAPRRVI